ncbi:2OG-Fe-II oxygenase [Cyathus striatus]|nr:2OG-Fe-II oxygenase [Cyathus striatus]
MAESLIAKAEQVNTSAFQHIPIIDFSNISSDDPSVKRALASEVRDACLSAGFFYVKNHGIPEAVIQDVLTAGRYFFSLPLETKIKLDYHKTPNFKGYYPLPDPKTSTATHEVFSIGWEPKEHTQGSSTNPTEDKNGMNAANIWPSEEDIPGFREKILEYYHKAVELGKLMFPLFALALNESEDFFEDKTKKSAAIMNLMFYPPQMRPEQTGIRPHTDWQCFTILYQEPGKQALQVLNTDNEWIDAPAIPGTLVVNIADQLSRWTNDLFKSTTHQAINVSGHERFSIPLFFGTDYDVKLEPIPSCISPERPWKYEVITAGEYVKSRMESNYR